LTGTAGSGTMIAEAMISIRNQPPASEPVGLLLAGARRRIKQAVLSLVHRRRLSAQQFWALAAIWQSGGGISLRALAERQRMDAPTTTRIVEALRKRGLIRTLGDPADRRRRCIYLTPRGRGVARRLYPQALRTRRAVEKGFSDAEKEALRGMLRRVISNMEAYTAACRRRTTRSSGEQRRA
jgi:DNA-binding MarR family transcriptional regulator